MKTAPSTKVIVSPGSAATRLMKSVMLPGASGGFSNTTMSPRSMSPIR